MYCREVLLIAVNNIQTISLRRTSLACVYRTLFGTIHTALLSDTFTIDFHQITSDQIEPVSATVLSPKDPTQGDASLPGASVGTFERAVSWIGICRGCRTMRLSFGTLRPE